MSKTKDFMCKQNIFGVCGICQDFIRENGDGELWCPTCGKLYEKNRLQREADFRYNLGKLKGLTAI